MDEVVIDESNKQLSQRYIGFSINPKYWGNGYATEATKEFIDYLFNDLKIDLIWTSHFVFNKRSKNVIKKCGFTEKFTQEKILKNYNNKIVEEVFYYLKSN